MKKILVIEDDVVLSKLLADNLGYEGFEVAVAHDGHEGLDMAFSMRPDLILMDLLMPKMDGLTMLGELREDSWGKDVPVLVMSNLSQPMYVTTAVTYNVQEYLMKVDWKMSDVIKIIHAKLDSTVVG